MTKYLMNALNAVYPFTFPKAVQTAATLCVFLTASACGKSGVYATTSAQQDLPPIGAPSADGVVVKARAIVPVMPGQGIQNLVGNSGSNQGTQGISVTNAANVSLSLSNTGWSVPAISNALLDFGYLAVTDVKDNNLEICGTNGNQHCGHALIRIYTTGKPGAGVWNSAGGYGAPITAGQVNATLGSVGLDSGGAYALQTVSIPATKHTVKFSDFPNPRYDVKADFTDAGAGSYSTTLVIEYGLSP